MHIPRSMLLALILFTPAMAPHNQPLADAAADAPAGPESGAAHRVDVGSNIEAGAAADSAAPAEILQVVALDDCIEFLMILADPGLQTEVIDAADYGDRLFVAVLHRFPDAARGGESWPVIYSFPATIFTHSIVQVPFHAAEMK